MRGQLEAFIQAGYKVQENYDMWYPILSYLENEVPQINHKTKIADLPNFNRPFVAIAEILPIVFVKTEKRTKTTKARLWRIIGEVFQKESWYKKGVYEEEEIPPYATRTRELRIRMQGFHYGPMYQTYIAFAYDPLSDTLFFKKK